MPIFDTVSRCTFWKWVRQGCIGIYGSWKFKVFDKIGDQERWEKYQRKQTSDSGGSSLKNFPINPMWPGLSKCVFEINAPRH